MENNTGLEGFVDVKGLKVSIKPYCTLRDVTPCQAEELLKKAGLRMLTLEEEVDVVRELKRRLEENPNVRESLGKLPDTDEVCIPEELKPLYRIYTDMLNSIGVVKKGREYAIAMPLSNGEIDELGMVEEDYKGEICEICPMIRGVKV